MSASTVSITANPSTTARRRHVERKPFDSVDFAAEPNNFTAAATTTVSPAADHAKLTVGDAARDAVALGRKSLPNNGPTPRRATATARKPSSKPAKPWWLTVITIFAKNLVLLVVLLGLAHIVRQLALKNGGLTGEGVNLVPGDYKGNMEKVEEFIKSTAKTMKMMQVQVDVLDRKIGDEIGSVKGEIFEKIDAKSGEIEAKLKELGSRTVDLESFVGQLGGKMENWLSKEEFNKFLEEFKKGKGGDSVSLDEVRVFARGIVEREIEKHAADGLGRVDYALASAGGMVLKHSEPYTPGGLISGPSWIPLTNRHKVYSDAEKMLRPSFGEPGQCFPLKGSSGFVQIKLRTAIIPEAVTLEHAAESVAYDRSSAPQNCRVSGWLQGDSSDLVADAEKMLLLTEFVYDLEKNNVQTFDVVDSARANAINMIKFEFSSNHGSPSHTCIYRLRVHGQEPNSVSTFAMQS
ncbi:SUN domain-containing protein 2-like [Coffea eugenioides]|uniref:SUN domain-containing protein 2-like n=1 Tax=Coffea eugenioides TaxID=49369 RepID=UPI000F607771|nr:SUN domain-containing protein 2-like [Coffea eugenioides]